MEEQSAATKNGLQLLSHLLAIANHVLEETKHMNLKPPLRPSSKLFAAEVPVLSSPSRSPSETEVPQDETSSDVNEQAVSSVNDAPINAVAQGHPLVLPYSFEEIQDTYTKIATLKTQYMKISAKLLEAVKYVGVKSETQQDGQEVMARLVSRRNHLRNEVFERNVVMKGLIDRLRNLQHSIRLMKGGSAYPPSIVMESV